MFYFSNYDLTNNEQAAAGIAVNRRRARPGGRKLPGLSITTYRFSRFEMPMVDCQFSATPVTPPHYPDPKLVGTTQASPNLRSSSGSPV